MTLTNLSPSPEAKTRVNAAIDRIKADDPAYWQRCQDQRDPRSPAAAGSVLHLVPTFTGDIESVLRACEWIPFKDDAILPQCTAFRTFDLAGRLGLVPLVDLGPDATVTLADPKETGKAEATVVLSKRDAERSRPFVQYTVIILGPTKDGGECVWTFHPGPPIRPSEVATPPEGERVISVEKARELGLKFAKIVVEGT
jgi:hypothetical protein